MIGFEKTSDITRLTDSRLIKINPSAPQFFDAVLNFESENEDINDFIDAIAKVKKANLDVFYTVAYDPSERQGEPQIEFIKGAKPAIGHSYNWWVLAVIGIPPVKGRKFRIGTEYQRYAMLMHLINCLIAEGNSVENAINMVVINSTELGKFAFSKEHRENICESARLFEVTGSRCICGFYDLGNTYKILKCSNKKTGGFWQAGGYYGSGTANSLAYLEYMEMDAADSSLVNEKSVGWIVLY